MPSAGEITCHLIRDIQFLQRLRFCGQVRIAGAHHPSLVSICPSTSGQAVAWRSRAAAVAKPA